MMRALKLFSVGMAVVMIAVLFGGVDISVASGENLLKNPGFEEPLADNYFNGWKINTGGDYITIVDSENPTTSICGGKYTESYTPSPNGGNYLSTPDKPNGTSTSVGVIQYISNPPGDRYYEFSAWYKCNLVSTALGSSSKNTKALIQVKDKDNVNYSYAFVCLSNTDGVWTKASHVFRVPQNALYITIQLLSNKQTENYSAFWDDVSVREIGTDNINFMGNAGDMEDARNMLVSGQPVEVPAHVKVFNGYTTDTPYNYGTLGENYLSNNETHDGTMGKSFKMMTSTGIENLSAVIDFQCAAGYAVSAVNDVSNYLLTGYFKTTGDGYARIREGKNLRPVATTPAEYDTDCLYSSGGQWEKFAALVPMDNANGHTLQLDFVGVGSVLWDDFVLAPFDALHNGDCEAVYGISADGIYTPTGFIASDAQLTITDSCHGGKYALKVDGSAAAAAPSVTIGKTGLTDITFTTGSTYRLSYWQKFDEVSDTVYMENNIGFIAAGEKAAYFATYRFPVQSAEWINCTVYFKILNTHNNVAGLSFKATGASVFYLDDIEITEVSTDADLLTGLYTKGSKDVSSITAGDISFTCNYASETAGESMYVTTVVYALIDNVKSLVDISTATAMTSISDDGVYLIPARIYSTVTVPSESGDYTVESFIWNSAAGMQPISPQVILKGDET